MGWTATKINLEFYSAFIKTWWYLLFMDSLFGTLLNLGKLFLNEQNFGSVSKDTAVWRNVWLDLGNSEIEFFDKFVLHSWVFHLRGPESE